PQSTIFQADIQPDGTLGPFTTSARTLPTAVGSFSAFAFGGNLYVIGGETVLSIDPNDTTSLGSDSRDVDYAPITRGDVGAFLATTKLGKERKKHVTWNAFGQVIVGEGNYGGSGSEMTRNDIQPDGSLGSWNGLTGGTAPSANVQNAAAVLSPISPQGGGPRFFLIGGDDLAGNALSTVWVNTAP
ncbi:MAG: hypothetical protein ACYTFG_09560, partial [Planctomycetota bacterium]